MENNMAGFPVTYDGERFLDFLQKAGWTLVPVPGHEDAPSMTLRDPKTGETHSFPESFRIESERQAKAETPGLACRLAVLERTLSQLEEVIAQLPNPEGHMPEECQKHECSYFDYYLAQGPADLTHEGYHAAEKRCVKIQEMVIRWYEEHENAPHTLRNPYERQADYWEKKVRA
jgi:hypothetical protein